MDEAGAARDVTQCASALLRGMSERLRARCDTARREWLSRDEKAAKYQVAAEAVMTWLDQDLKHVIEVLARIGPILDAADPSEAEHVGVVEGEHATCGVARTSARSRRTARLLRLFLFSGNHSCRLHSPRDSGTRDQLHLHPGKTHRTSPSVVKRSPASTVPGAARPSSSRIRA